MHFFLKLLLFVQYRKGSEKGNKWDEGDLPPAKREAIAPGQRTLSRSFNSSGLPGCSQVLVQSAFIEVNNFKIFN